MTRLRMKLGYEIATVYFMVPVLIYLSTPRSCPVQTHRYASKDNNHTNIGYYVDGPGVSLKSISGMVSNSGNEYMSLQAC